MTAVAAEDALGVFTASVCFKQACSMSKKHHAGGGGLVSLRTLYERIYDYSAARRYHS